MRLNRLYLCSKDGPYLIKAAIHRPSVAKDENTINIQHESTGFFFRSKLKEISKIKVGVSQLSFLIVKNYNKTNKTELNKMILAVCVSNLSNCIFSMKRKSKAAVRCSTN